MPASLRNHAPRKCWFDPTPEVAKPLPGLFFIVSMNSWSVLIFSEAWTAHTSGWRAMKMTGTRSFW